MPFDPLPEKAGRVATDRMVCASADDDVRAVVICPSLIYGQGQGVRDHSPQIPTFIALAKAGGVPQHIGAGANVWSNVHIEDCADAYLLALEHAPAGAFYFVENGAAAMVDMARAIGRLLGLGETTRALPMAEAVRAWGPPMAYAMGANVRVSADKARAQLGWSPHRPPLLEDIEHGSYRKYV